MHRFFCGDCQNFISGMTPQRLATNVNDHMLSKHPLRYAGYSGDSVVNSPSYRSPNAVASQGPRPEYLKPHALTTRSEWGNDINGYAMKPPDITEDDIDMLRRHYITW